MLHAEEPKRRSVLDLWRHIFSNVEDVKAQGISMDGAQRAVATWPKLSYQDTPRYFELYHDYLLALRDLLAGVKAEAFDFVGDDDGVENHEDYVNLLVEWHVCLDQIKEAWDAADPESHIQVAALVDVGGFVFNQTGLLGHLGAIGFDLDDEYFMGLVRAAKEAR